MSKDMLGPIVWALIPVEQHHLGLIFDLTKKLGGSEADAVHRQVAAALREKPAPESAPEPIVLNTLIRVDRAVRPVYPDWADAKWINAPEFIALEKIGPAEYALPSINLWLHDGQKNGGVTTGNRIYDDLKSNNMLEGCLGLADGLAIQQKGIEVFRKFFGGKAMFLWKSVVQYRVGFLFVPFLIEFGGLVVVLWHWLGHDWLGDLPAARFAS